MENTILNPIDYVAALGWTILGIALVKAIIYPKGEKFILSKWVSENIKEVIIGVLACPILMQLGAVTLTLLQIYMGFDMSGVEQALNSAHLDSIQLTLILSIFIQWKLYTNYKKKQAKLQ